MQSGGGRLWRVFDGWTPRPARSSGRSFDRASAAAGSDALCFAIWKGRARELGYRKLRLDTARAPAFFRRVGYSKIPDYNGNQYARHRFEKDLSAT
jgi:hypothetical protein